VFRYDGRRKQLLLSFVPLFKFAPGYQPLRLLFLSPYYLQLLLLTLWGRRVSATLLIELLVAPVRELDGPGNWFFFSLLVQILLPGRSGLSLLSGYAVRVKLAFVIEGS